MKRIINTSQAPAAIGPYSQAVEVNGTLYISGQIPLDPKNMKIVDVIPLSRGINKDTLSYFTIRDVSAGAIVPHRIFIIPPCFLHHRSGQTTGLGSRCKGRGGL